MKISTISIFCCTQLAFTSFSYADWEYPNRLKNNMCNGDRCVRLSEEYTPHTKIHDPRNPFCANSFPIIEISNDHGKTWNQKLSGSHLPSNAIEEGQHGYFRQLHCNENLCIALGKYDTDKSTSQPLMAISSDGGDTWNYEVISTNTFSMPYQAFIHKNTIIVGGTCSSAIEREGRNYRVNVPCLNVSADNGKTWERKFTPADIPEKNFSPYLDDELQGFNNIACNQKFCIAAGNYRLFFGKTKDDFLDIRTMPLLIVSHDAGQTWQIKLASDNLPSDVGLPQIWVSFRQVSCDEKRCVVSGDYFTATHERRLFDVVSIDGNTWNYELGAVIQN